MAAIRMPPANQRPVTNNNDVVILGKVSTSVGTAGVSAAQEAARLRRARWRWSARAGGLGGVGAAALAGERVAAGHLGALPAGAGRGLVLLAVVALVGAAVAAVVAGSFDPDRWERGATGERATAAELAGLARRGWVVWHDLRVPASRANIDHVVVGRTGVWIVDTKTTRTEVRAGRWRGVRFGTRRLDTAPVRWEADVVSEEIARQLGRAVSVRPIVAVHGRGLRRRGGRASGVKVVPAAEVARQMRRGRRRLTREEMAEVVAAIEASLEASLGAARS